MKRGIEVYLQPYFPHVMSRMRCLTMLYKVWSGLSGVFRTPPSWSVPPLHQLMTTLLLWLFFLTKKYFVNIELKILTICWGWECMMWGGGGGISYLVGTPGLLQPSNSVTLSNVTLDLSLPLQSHLAASGEEK